MQVNQTV